MSERLSALSRTLTKYSIIAIAICLVAWIATLIFYLTDTVPGITEIFFIWQFVYYGAPALCGVLVGFWLVTRIWIRSSVPSSEVAVPSPDGPVAVPSPDGLDDEPRL